MSSQRRETTDLKYYSFNAVLSRNAVYNFIIGARGLGKTYGAKRKAIRDFLTRGDQFIYLRRYSTELKSALPTLFADVGREFPDVRFRVIGAELQAMTDLTAAGRWRTMGWGVALSKAQQKKSVAYPDVKTIIFDEFIIERGAIHYLPEEARAFNEFFSTVDRWKDKTRVLFLANSISIMNPYFIEYGIKPRDGQEWVTGHNNFIVAHFAKADEFAQGVYHTRFGRFIQGTEYAQYAVGGIFSDNSDTMIGPKSSQAKYYCTLETRNGTFSVWIDYTSPVTFYVLDKRPKEELFWTMLPERMEEHKTLVVFSDKMLQTLRTAYSRGRVTFNNPQARNAFIGIFRR